MKTRKLTAKQERFCHEYVIDLNATQAAIRAGYSKKAAKEVGSRLLTYANIAGKISELNSDLAKASMIGALKIVEEQKRIAFASIASIYSDWTKLKDFDILTDDQKAAIKSINTKTTKKRAGTENGKPAYTDVEYVKIEMHDKVRALETLSKMLGYDMPQRFEITGKDGEPLFNKMDLSKLSNDELITLHALIEKASTNDSGMFPL